MVRVKKSADERKKQILDAAFKLFSEHNYHVIVMEDIAKECNIARTTLYEYYSNKEDILIAMLERIASEARQINIHGDTCKESLENLAEDLIDKIQSNKAIYRILFQATPVMSNKLSPKLMDWRNQSYLQILEVASKGKELGEIKSNIQIHDVTFAFQAFIGQLTGELIMKNEEVNPKEKAKNIVNILWNGIGKDC